LGVVGFIFAAFFNPLGLIRIEIAPLFYTSSSVVLTGVIGSAAY
jgi:hypothetical protein